MKEDNLDKLIISVLTVVNKFCNTSEIREDVYPLRIRRRELICKFWQNRLRFFANQFKKILCLKPSGLKNFVRLPLALNLLSVFIRQEVLPL